MYDNNQLVKKLDAMVNKTWQYGNQIFYVISYKIDGDKVFIKTNVKDFDRPLESINDFLSYWSDASQIRTLVPIPADEQLKMYQSEENVTADKLIGILESNIEKLQTDPKFIPQATAINNNINSIINIQKMKLAFMRKVKR